ncbi:hypothetical protein, partial [Succinimonas amylolytica]|uniref:hypothetical protein n=1 Tax=Succinimonas amylolytica TaxID=83769 RepID=UPI001B7FBDC9
FLKAPISEEGKVGNKVTIGTPQGGLCRYRHNPPYAELVVMPSKLNKNTHVSTFFINLLRIKSSLK